MTTTQGAAAPPAAAAPSARASEAQPEGGATAPHRRRRPDPVACVAAVLVLLPTIAAAISALRNPWAPTNDWALLELQVRDVGTGDTPLVGAWSRFGWDHPGPLPFYALAAAYRLVPAEHGLLFAAAVVNLLAVAGAAALVLTQTRARALVALAGLAVLQRGLGVANLSDPWNPTLPIMPFALYALLCVEVAGGRRRWAVPAAAGLAAFVVQAHVGLAQPVLALGLVALAMRRWWPRPATAAAGSEGPGQADPAGPGRRPGGRATSRMLSALRGRNPVGPTTFARAALPTGVVVLVAWLPVLLDQVAGSGNIGSIVRWTLGDEVGPGMGVLTEGQLPIGRVAGAAAWLLDPTGVWAGRFTPVQSFGLALLGSRSSLTLLWVPLAAAAVVLLARRARAVELPALAGAGAVAVAGVAATVGDLVTARGAPVVWPFRWAGVVVMLAWLAVGWAVVAALSTQARGWRPAVARAASAGGVALVAVPVALTLWHGSLGDQPRQDASTPLLRLAPAIEEEARRLPVVVANSQVKLDDVDLGLPVVLDRAGIAWVERDDPRAEGHPALQVSRAEALDGLAGYAVAVGYAEVVARSGTPTGNEPPDSELILLRVDPRE